MTASPASVKTSRWAKFLLFGSTMLFAYSLLVLLAAHAHHYHHHEHGEHRHHHRDDHDHPPHDPRHFGDRHSHSLVAAGKAAEAEEDPHGRGMGIHHHREEEPVQQRDGGAPPNNKQGEPEEEEGGHHHHHNHHHHDGHRQHQHHHDDGPPRKEEGPHSDGSLVKSEGHQRDEGPHNGNGDAFEATKKHSHKQHQHPGANHEAVVEGEEGKKKESGPRHRDGRRKEEGHSDDAAVPKGGISHQKEEDRDHPHEQYKGPHAHGRGHRRHHRQNDGPHQQMMAPVHHVAGLAMITALTGIAASFTQRRGLATVFIVVLLVTELAALGAVSHGAKKAVERCYIDTASDQHRVEERRRTAGGPSFSDPHQGAGTPQHRDKTLGEEEGVNKAGGEDCIKRVHHHIALGSLMIGVICTALACCGGRMGRAMVEEEVESAKMREASHLCSIIQVSSSCPSEDDSSAAAANEPETAVLITRA